MEWVTARFLAALEAADSIRPEVAADVLSELVESDDQEIAMQADDLIRVDGYIWSEPRGNPEYAPSMNWKKLVPPMFLLGCGAALLALTSTSTLRFAKAEAASYLFTAVGALWLAFALIRLFTAVKPEVGRVVQFWGPDGRTKLSGPIVERSGDKLVVETPQGRYTLEEAHLLNVRK